MQTEQRNYLDEEVLILCAEKTGGDGCIILKSVADNAGIYAIPQIQCMCLQGLPIWEILLESYPHCHGNIDTLRRLIEDETTIYEDTIDYCYELNMYRIDFIIKGLKQRYLNADAIATKQCAKISI